MFKKAFPRKALLLIVLAAALILITVWAVMAGAYDLSAASVLGIIKYKLFGGANALDGSGEAFTRMQEIIVWQIRLPRVFLAIIVGIALSVAGAVYQSCFRNPLVEPYILGVSSGAAFGAALGIVIPSFLFGAQFSAFFFALAAVGIAWFLARSGGQTPTVTLILSGVIVGSVFTALVSLLKYMSDDTQLREITFWMMGGFYYATWSDVALNAAVVLVCFAAVFLLSWRLNILTLGDDEARTLGISPDVHKAVFIVLSTLMVATCVSTVGIVAWVGLMMPHAARMLFGPDNRWVIPGGACMGAIYVVLCDTIARTLSAAEIPVGIITAILGAPYLAWLLRSKGRAIFT